MTRILLTGGSGFLAAHVLEALLRHDHSIVATVRSDDKANAIRNAHPNVGKDRLDFVIVKDISQADAFDHAVVSEPPFETVIHTASPFHFNMTDLRKDLLDPAVNGTTEILKSINKLAPTVTRVVLTSSFAAMIDVNAAPGKLYSEADWNPMTLEDAEKDGGAGYRASKTFAEKAAWDFMEREKPQFTLATINPPLIFGPVVHYLNSLDSLNTSNQIFRTFITGAAKEKCPPPPSIFWVDVRDVAMAHVLAAEKLHAGGKRFFLSAGQINNKEIVAILAAKIPEIADKLPQGEALKDGGIKAEFFTDNSRSKEVLGLSYRSLEESVVDSARSLLPHL